MLSAFRKANPIRLAVFLLFAFTAYRLWFSTHLELVPDEAYYWLWSKHPAASYRDKGPLITWLIIPGTWLFGHTVFGIRFFGILLSSSTGWLVFLLARRLYDDRVALWSLLMALVMPLFAVGSILMTIDTPSVFFWVMTALIFWRALHDGKTITWFWMGLAIGAGFLAKFTNGVQIICIGLFLLWSKEHRVWLFSRKMFVWGAAFLLSITPLLWWNIQTGWIHIAALHSRSGVKSTFGIHFGELFQFVGEIFGVMSPLFAAGMVVAAIGLLWQRPSDLRTRFLLSQSVPLVGLFLFFSLNKAGKSNWISPALITGIIFTVVFWREVVARRPVWRWGVGTAFVMALLMSVVMHDTRLLNLPPKRDPLRRAEGWADFGAHVQQARLHHRATVLIGNHYSQASMMAFYLPDQPTVYLPPEKYGKSQFTLWPGYEVHPDTRALYVTTSAFPPPKVLWDQFSKIEQVDDFVSQYHGRPMTQFYIYLCTND